MIEVLEHLRDHRDKLSVNGHLWLLALPTSFTIRLFDGMSPFVNES